MYLLPEIKRFFFVVVVVVFLLFFSPACAFSPSKFVTAQCPSNLSILHKSIAGRYRPVSYPDGLITAHYRFM